MIDAKRVLATGGAGLICSTIVDQLVSAGDDEVVVYDNLERGNLSNLDGEGLLGGYLWRTFEESRRRPLHVFGAVTPNQNQLLDV